MASRQDIPVRVVQERLEEYEPGRCHGRLGRRPWREVAMSRVRLVFAVGFAVLLVSSVPADAEVITNEKVDFTGLTVFVSCANGGAGELVALEGRLHRLFALTVDKTGGFHMTDHTQPQALRGVGAVTGTKYQAQSVDQQHLNGHVGQTFTSINNLRLIGQGRGNNLLLRETFHITVNANGVVTAVHDSFSAECK
jgi:hypothetical protein